MSKRKREFKEGEIIIFSEKEKRKIIEEYLQSGNTKRAIWKKYTGRKKEHGRILSWMRKYGYIPDNKKKNIIFAQKKYHMNDTDNQLDNISEFEILQLKRRVLELEKQLKESEMKTIAYQTLIEIAERELDVSIKKNFNIKQ